MENRGNWRVWVGLWYNPFSLLPTPVRLATTLDNSRPLLTAISNLPNPKDASSTLIEAARVGGIPANATGIVGNLTNLGCTGGGNFRFWTGETVPVNATLCARLNPETFLSQLIWLVNLPISG